MPGIPENPIGFEAAKVPVKDNVGNSPEFRRLEELQGASITTKQPVTLLLILGFLILLIYLLVKYLLRKPAKSKREEELLGFEIVGYFEPNKIPLADTTVRVNNSRKILPYNSCNKDEVGAKFKMFGFDFKNVDKANTNNGLDTYFRIYDDNEQKLLYQSEICHNDSTPDWITFVFNQNKVKYDWPFAFKFFEVKPEGEDDEPLGYFIATINEIKENDSDYNYMVSKQSMAERGLQIKGMYCKLDH